MKTLELDLREPFDEIHIIGKNGYELRVKGYSSPKVEEHHETSFHRAGSNRGPAQTAR